MMIPVEMATADSINDSDSFGNNEFHAGGEVVGVGEAVAVNLVEAEPFLTVTECFSRQDSVPINREQDGRSDNSR